MDALERRVLWLLLVVGLVLATNNSYAGSRWEIVVFLISEFCLAAAAVLLLVAVAPGEVVQAVANRSLSASDRERSALLALALFVAALVLIAVRVSGIAYDALHHEGFPGG